VVRCNARVSEKNKDREKPADFTYPSGVGIKGMSIRPLGHDSLVVKIVLNCQ
jgi:hypothetical protein